MDDGNKIGLVNGLEERVVTKLRTEHHLLYSNTYLFSEYQLQVHSLCHHRHTLLLPDTLYLAASLNREKSESASEMCSDCNMHIVEIKIFK